MKIFSFLLLSSYCCTIRIQFWRSLPNVCVFCTKEIFFTVISVLTNNTFCTDGSQSSALHPAGHFYCPCLPVHRTGSTYWQSSRRIRGGTISSVFNITSWAPALQMLNFRMRIQTNQGFSNFKNIILVTWKLFSVNFLPGETLIPILPLLNVILTYILCCFTATHVGKYTVTLTVFFKMDGSHMISHFNLDTFSCHILFRSLAK